MSIQKSILIYTLALLLGNGVYAQSKQQIKAQHKRNPPKVVLVELLTHTSKIDYYKRTKQNAKASQLVADAQNIIQKTVADFNANFKFCPVYYFYDTNASLIMDRKFESVLLDKDLIPVKQVPISGADTSYLIVNYGPAAISKRSYDTTTGPKNNLDRGVAGNVLINSYKYNILNYKFDPLPPFILFDKKSVFRASNPVYSYTSKTINISYKGQANFLNSKFADFYPSRRH